MNEREFQDFCDNLVIGCRAEGMRWAAVRAELFKYDERDDPQFYNRCLRLVCKGLLRLPDPFRTPNLDALSKLVSQNEATDPPALDQEEWLWNYRLAQGLHNYDAGLLDLSRQGDFSADWTVWR